MIYIYIFHFQDKMFLLNTQPFLTKNLKEIAASLQKSADNIYLAEQKNFSQRAERLNTGKVTNSAPRSLQELTGESNIYAHLHSQFAWILWAGARYFSETLTLGNPSTAVMFKDKDIENGFTFIQMDKEEFFMKNFPERRCRDTDETLHDLRRLKTNTKSHFTQICYCILVGIQVVVRGPPEQCTNFIRHFKELLPLESHRLIVENSPKCLSASKCKILSLSPEVPITQNMSNVFRVDFMDKTEVPITKWSGELPVKCDL